MNKTGTSNRPRYTAEYNILAKYNSELSDQSFEEFMKEHEDPQSEQYGKIQYQFSNGIYSLRNPELQGSSSKVTYNFIYTGYLDFTSIWVSWPNVYEFYIDNQLLEKEYHQDVTGGVSYEVNFQGYVQEGFKIEVTDLSAQVNFSKFCWNPNKIEISDLVYDNYSIKETELENNQWGEIDIKFSYPVRRNTNLDWANKENDVIEQRMAFWDKEIFGMMLSNPKNNLPSGYDNITLREATEYFPILIHKTDIGKKNTIGIMTPTQGDRFEINLTII